MEGADITEVPCIQMIESAVYKWFVDQGMQGTPVSVPVILCEGIKMFKLALSEDSSGESAFHISEG